ncbi:hypothetical protein BGX26_001541, partial [Mortierella sp. AD094]
GSTGLDQKANDDGGHGDWDGARVPLRSQEGAEVLGVSVDGGTEVLANGGESGRGSDRGFQSTSNGSTNALANAERVGARLKLVMDKSELIAQMVQEIWALATAAA